MRKITWYLMVVHIVAAGVTGAFWLWPGLFAAVEAQGTRAFTPEGFEFPATTRAFKYHFPRSRAAGAVYTGTWIAENAEEVRPNFQIDSAEIRPTTETVLNFSLSKPEGDWPPGLYRLEIRADGKLVHTERFVVR